MKKIILPSLFAVLFSGPIAAQQAQVGEGQSSLLIWPFENSFYVDETHGSDGWTMICGHGCGLHKASDHFALDWSRRPYSACGSKFYAPLSGEVIYVRLSSNSGYGNQVVIQSDQDTNYAFRMAHMETVYVKAGERVEVDDLLGLVGDTGNGGCHGHLTMYRHIYERAEPLDFPGDTTRYYKAALDYLKTGQVVPAPKDNPTYFSEPYGFARDQEGLSIKSFSINGPVVAIEDSLHASVRLTNIDARSWSGQLAIELQETDEYRYLNTPPLQGSTDTFTIPAGESREFSLTLDLLSFSPDHYYVYLVFITENELSELGAPLQARTPLRNAQVELMSKEKCNLDEPNDEEAMAVDLIGQTPANEVLKGRREDYISVFEDEKDLFSITPAQTGRLTLGIQDTFRFFPRVFNEQGEISLKRQFGGFNFLASPGQTYYVEISGKKSCSIPYQLTYEWTPVEGIEWTFSAYEQVNSRFLVLEPSVVEWRIVDMMGRQLYSSGPHRLEAGEYFYQEELDNLSPGIYLAVLFVDGRITDQKKFFWR